MELPGVGELTIPVSPYSFICYLEMRESVTARLGEGYKVLHLEWPKKNKFMPALKHACECLRMFNTFVGR